MTQINRIRLCSEMREHLMALARFAFVPERGDVDGCRDDPLAGTWRGLGEETSIEIHDLAPSGP